MTRTELIDAIEAFLKDVHVRGTAAKTIEGVPDDIDSLLTAVESLVDTGEARYATPREVAELVVDRGDWDDVLGEGK